jgi:hypothetical protein
MQTTAETTATVASAADDETTFLKFLLSQEFDDCEIYIDGNGIGRYVEQE